MLNQIEHPNVMQIGIVLPDAKTAAEKASRIFNVPIAEQSTFGKRGGYEHCNTMYKGEPSDASGRNYILKMGQVDLEFIEPVGDDPGVFTDFLKEHPKGGLHHLAWRVRDTEKYTEFLNAKGIEKLQEGVWETGRYTYYDTTDMGFFMELLEFFDQDY